MKSGIIPSSYHINLKSHDICGTHINSLEILPILVIRNDRIHKALYKITERDHRESCL